MAVEALVALMDAATVVVSFGGGDSGVVCVAAYPFCCSDGEFCMDGGLSTRFSGDFLAGVLVSLGGLSLGVCGTGEFYVPLGSGSMTGE